MFYKVLFYIPSGAKVDLQFVSMQTQFILLVFVNYGMTFHTSNSKSTFALPCITKYYLAIKKEENSAFGNNMGNPRGY